MRCIYCLVEKQPASFNRDHVIPQAFGVFDDNLVLTCVCRECNSFFGDGVELKLARDSLEGHDRVQLGIADATSFKGLGKRRTTQVEFGADSPVPGAEGYLVAPAAGTALAVTLKPRVGFAHAPDGPFDWWPLDRLPSKEELGVAKGYRRGDPLHVQTQGEAATEEFVAALAQKGFSCRFDSETPPPTGSAQVVITFTLARPEFRAIAKIAFNYFAAAAGPGVVLASAFDGVRRFVLGDEGPCVVTPPRASAREALKLHYVSVQSVGGMVIAHVSLMMRNRYYEVVLASDGFEGEISSAHFFNVDTRQVVATNPLPVSAAW
jgi:hypothetical protein